MSNKIYVTPSPYSWGYSPASHQTIQDAMKFSNELGFRVIELGKRLNVPLNPVTYYGCLYRWGKHAEVLLATYPYICRPTREYHCRRYETKLINNICKNNLSILYIIDLPIEQALASSKLGMIDEKCYQLEQIILESFDYLLVFNEKMKQNIQEKYSIEDDRFIQFEILDYSIDYIPDNKKTCFQPIRIVYAGSLSKNSSEWIHNFPHDSEIVLDLCGPGGNWMHRLKPNVFYKGLMPQSSFYDFLSKHHFGLIYRDFSDTNYYEYTSTSKFSAYMVAGLPILCPSKFVYLSQLTEKYKVGLVFNEFKDIPFLMKKITKENYNGIRTNCLSLGKKIKTGYFFKKAIRKVIDVE